MDSRQNATMADASRMTRTGARSRGGSGQTELMVPCATWNPTSFLSMVLPPQQMGEVEQIAPQLTVAIGAALAAL